MGRDLSPCPSPKGEGSDGTAGAASGMVAAVYFDRDSVLIADEVRYERAEGLLALEVKSREPIGSQIIPKVTFGGS